MPVKDFVTLHYQKIAKESIMITEKTSLWCQLPYKGYKNGCPNYGDNSTCPPHEYSFRLLINQYQMFYLIYAKIDFVGYKNERKIAHPNWSERQLGNPRHWQASVKKMLREELKKIYSLNRTKKLYLCACGSGFKDKAFTSRQKVYSMESLQIDVFNTLKKNLIEFEIKPVKKVLLVCLLSSDKKLILKTPTIDQYSQSEEEEIIHRLSR